MTKRVEMWKFKDVISVEDLLLTFFSYSELYEITKIPMKQIHSNINLVK